MKTYKLFFESKGTCIACKAIRSGYYPYGLQMHEYLEKNLKKDILNNIPSGIDIKEVDPTIYLSKEEAQKVTENGLVDFTNEGYQTIYVEEGELNNYVKIIVEVYRKENGEIEKIKMYTEPDESRLKRDVLKGKIEKSKEIKWLNKKIEVVELFEGEDWNTEEDNNWY